MSWSGPRDEAPGFTPGRPQDKAIAANIVRAMTAYQQGELGPKTIDLSEVDRIIAIGSDGMMAAVARARHEVLKPWLKPRHHAIGSINSPMQCMMKEVCAQCLQRHHDPETGKETIVFSCFNQDQPLDAVDFGALRRPPQPERGAGEADGANGSTAACGGWDGGVRRPESRSLSRASALQ